MYVPPLFAFDDAGDMAAFCRAHPFAALVTHGPEGLFATHLPVVLKSEGKGGAFFGHIARANPHWQKAADGAEGLLIFTGAQAYVTPSWYATKRETAKVVPTWNYAAVHARGRITWTSDAGFLHQNLADLTEAHEARFAHPWALSDAPDDFVEKQMRAIVGLRFEITGLIGKRKMSQNRPAADIDGVVEGLSQSGEAGDREVAGMVEALRPR
ncbi:FMN-binding negative transcriptional regulator [Phreatobacter sp.]|uniref:FMN-binding negative transcriptional regulator n=1 Tax=Phreatobacter sp. TaxID=1966341 RepID=UPI003F6FD661